jgi:hypothetical protein
MEAGIITGWVILFGLLFSCKANHIFELNTTQEESSNAYYGYGATEKEESEDEATVLKKSHYRKMLRRTFLMCF